MKASRWPEWLDDVWAKSPDKGAGGQPESLPQHTWYVLERLAELIRLRPRLPQTLDVPRLWPILFWAAFLHDWGKAANSFQARLRGGPKWSHRHEVLSLAFLDWIAAGFTPGEQSWIAAAIVAHHRDAAEIQELYASPEDPDDDQLIALVGELAAPAVCGLWRWLVECSANWIDSLGLAQQEIVVPDFPTQPQALAGVQQDGATRIRYWLQVYRRFVRQLRDCEDRALVIGTLTLRGHLINADHSASAHAGPLPCVSFDAGPILQKLGRDTLFQHQSKAWETSGSALLTAPTGSGKTEAALLWAVHQAAATGGLPRLFYTLPYQASMNAMQLRLAEAFGEKNVGLQHGRSLLSLYRQLLERDYTPESAARQARGARDMVKLNYPPVRVFSPYQMLKGMYRLKGYEAVLSDYHGAAFILDEIHAYEVRRLAMILKTVEYLSRNFDARFLIMSATFPTLIKDWLCQALDSPLDIQAEPALFARFRRHRLVLLDHELLSEDGVNRIARDAQAGKSVLVVCNLVRRAQEIYHILRGRLNNSGVHVELLHGRFNMRDRSTKETLVREATGTTSLHRQSIVLVATQVVEVSLDIDLDTIYTDPAPLEALVQRFGRVNRRRKQKQLAPVCVYRQPDDGQKIYDQELVTRTLDILERQTRALPPARRERGFAVDESAIGIWLDEIYSGDLAQRWRSEYEHAASEFEAVCVRPLRAFESDSSLEDLFYKAFDGIEVLPEPLYDEYQELVEQEPIRASELLVPISWGRYHTLAGQGRILPGERDMPRIARADYSPEIGLAFE